MAPITSTGQRVLPLPHLALRAVLARWAVLRATRRGLARLDPRMLRDIGLDPAARAAECDKPFWQE